MNVVETIREKVFHLPPKAQEEVLEMVEKIEERYHMSLIRSDRMARVSESYSVPSVSVFRQVLRTRALTPIWLMNL